MAPTSRIFELSKIVMPSRGPKCLKIYYCGLEDRALTKELVDCFGSSPQAKNLLKCVVNRVIPLLHCSMPHVGSISFEFLLKMRWNWFWTFKFQRKRCAVHHSMQFQNCNQNCISRNVAFQLRISNLHQSCITTW